MVNTMIILGSNAYGRVVRSLVLTESMMIINDIGDKGWREDAAQNDGLPALNLVGDLALWA